jgi:hypothetical protein
MKLKRIQNLPSMKLVGTIPGDIGEALTAYAEYYREVHGEEIKPWPLVIQILRTFVEEDRGFQAWRRRSNATSPGSAGGRAANGARAEARNG